MSVGRRLLQYALFYKKTISIALVMLTIAVCAELSGPLIAKQMIDNNILGIEKPWVETAQGTKDAVQYKGGFYKRSDRLEEGEQRGKEVRLLQSGVSFYFLNQSLPFDGERLVADGTLTVKSKNQSAEYAVEQLTKQQLFAFYKPEIKALIQLMALYLGLIAVASFFQYYQKLLLQSSANRIIQRMRMDVFKQIQRLPIHYFDNLPAGKVVSRVTNDTESIQELYVTVLATFVNSAIYMAGIFAAMFFLDAKLAAVSMLLIPIVLLWIVLYRKSAERYNHRIRALLSDINAMINESIQGMSIIRAFRRQEETQREFDELNEQHFANENKLLNLNALTSHNLVGVLRNIAFVMVIWYFGGASLQAGSLISIGVLYAFVDYLTRLFGPVTNVVNQLGKLETARVSAERVFELMDTEGTDVAEGQLPRYKGNVRFEDVSFAYKEDYVLKNITFEAKQGQTVALVGHTGSGKSSIMNLLFRFYDPQKGAITIDGQSIVEIPKQLLRQHMGIVLQDPFLFTGTIASNVSLDDPAISRKAVNDALNAVGADKLLSSLPKGYDEPVIEKGSTLSAGQRQLVSFARALAFNPAILILDEATASIDTETETIIQNALDVLKKGRTTFIIAHRLSTIRSADQILVLHRGEVVERGDHESLMGLGGRYYQMYQLQQGAKVSVGKEEVAEHNPV
ncbi:multidrug ABC transporter permease [Paenibacillus swuensis]|uniref:Multidrug ABC transporter permease n=1 Tax=Paenibacillus swuensis TaxID=1178515 RepID=A0A172TPC5_9BACL|nr:ABC transporter ATP-binding protein [Paenibacillus swuensis]ANE48939.1 multidrug ABC transporter permease [Paenibacillus swuensis]